MSNLGGYQALTTLAKKVGGPGKLVALIAGGGVLVGGVAVKGGEFAIRKGKKAIAKRKKKRLLHWRIVKRCISPNRTAKVMRD